MKKNPSKPSNLSGKIALPCVSQSSWHFSITAYKAVPEILAVAYSKAKKPTLIMGRGGEEGRAGCIDDGHPKSHEQM